MSLEKFNAIKILEERQKENDMFNRNSAKEEYMNKVYNFIDNYIEPTLKKKLEELDLKASQEFIDKLTNEVMTYTDRTDEEKEEMLKIEHINKFYKEQAYNEILHDTTFFVNEIGLIDIEDYQHFKEDNSKEENICSFLEEDEIGFLDSTKKVKEKVAKKILLMIDFSLKEIV